MAVIRHDFLRAIDERHDLRRVMDTVRNRHNRMSFERVLGVLLCAHDPSAPPPVLGDIHRDGPAWGYTFERYKDEPGRHGAGAVKVWSSR